MNRSLFKGFLLLAVCLLVFSACGRDSGGSHHRGNPKPVTHIILFIGDGMQLENEIATSRYLYGSDRAMVWDSFPYQAFVTTWDVNSYNVYASDAGASAYDETTFDPVIGYDPAQGGTEPYPLVTTGAMPYLVHAATDSASAATAYATGIKTESGRIAWRRGGAPGGELTALTEMLRSQKDAAFGVLTTVPISHATPAAFVSHNVSRNNYFEIADEIINVTQPEVAIGAGHPNWVGGYLSSAQLDALRVSPIYSLVERVSGQDGGANLLYAASTLAPDRKLFGLFGGAGGNFEPPVPHNNPGHPGFIITPENPSLGATTQAALEVLNRNPNGFFLMVESGDIDWANHANDFASMVGCVWRLEDAVETAIDFVNRPGDDLDWTNTLIIVTADHATGGLRLNPAMPLGLGELPAQSGSSYPNGEVAYNTGGHTNELVTLYALGARLDLFDDYAGTRYQDTRIIDNTQVFQVMSRAAGLQ